MKTANVLVSREKYVKLLQVAYAHHQHYIEARLPSSAKPVMDVLSMPDFIESERDVEVVRAAIQVYANQSSPNMSDHVSRLRAQAAINALRYRKEGE